MSRPITWFRLYRGRVWHVRAGAEAEAAPAERVAQPVDLVAALRASVEAAKARSEAVE